MQEGDTGRRRKTLDPKLDIVFWMLFGAEQNRELLISLLNAVLSPTVPIEAVEVLPAQPERLAVGDKNISLDLRLRLQGGEQVDVEMQSQRRPALRARALYYWARLYTGQLQRGDPYTALRRCVVVLITSFAELTNQRFHSIFQVHERDGGELLTGHLELHLLELPKLPRALDRNDEPNLALWGKFLAAGADEELEKLAMEHPVLKQAKAALDRLSADDIARLQAEQREMALLTFEAGMAAAREEAEEKGRREGHQEGRSAGTAEVLLRLLTIKFGPQPASVAERLASASQADLLRWSENVLSAEALEGVFT
jgi:predicted transposase/invertase (TIGR01784 family)